MKLPHSRGFSPVSREAKAGIAVHSAALSGIHVNGGVEQKKALTTPGGEKLLKAAGMRIIDVGAEAVDADAKDVKPGEAGEVIARGNNILQGCWNKPRETAAAPIDRWYWTKDLA